MDPLRAGITSVGSSFSKAVEAFKSLIDRKTQKIDVDSAVQSVKQGQAIEASGKFNSMISMRTNRDVSDGPYAHFAHSCVASVTEAILGKIENFVSTKPRPDSGKGQMALNKKLYDAVKIGNFVGAIKALKEGADPNFCPDGDNSVLNAAVGNNSENMVKLLLKYGAQVIDNNGENNIALALATGHTDLAKSMYDKDPAAAEYGHEVKMLTHRFALPQVGKTSFEGYYTKITALELQRSAQSFLSDADNRMPDVNNEKVGRAVNNALSAKNAMNALRSGEIVAIQTSWATKKDPKNSSHAVSIALFQGPNKDFYLIKCNRGLGRNADQALEIFKIGNPKGIDQAVAQLRRNQRSIQEGETYFTTGINEALKLEPHPAAGKNGIQHKDQSIGNCSWAQAKLLVEAVAYASLIQNGVTHGDAVAKSYSFYKAFTNYDRKQAIDSFFMFLKSTPSDQLADDKMALAGLPPINELLSELIKNASLPRDIEGLQKIIKHLGMPPEKLAEAFLESKTLKDGVIGFGSAFVLAKYVSSYPELQNNTEVKELMAKCILRSLKDYNNWRNTSPELAVKLFNQLQIYGKAFPEKYELTLNQCLSLITQVARATWKNENPGKYQEFIKGINLPNDEDFVREVRESAIEFNDPTMLVRSGFSQTEAIFLTELKQIDLPKDFPKLQQLIDARPEALTGVVKRAIDDKMNAYFAARSDQGAKGSIETLNFIMRNENIFKGSNLIKRTWEAIRKNEREAASFINTIFIPGAPIFKSREGLKGLIEIMSVYRDFTTLAQIESSLSQADISLRSLVQESRVYGGGNSFDESLRFSLIRHERLGEKMPPLGFLIKNGADPNRMITSSDKPERSIATMLISMKAWDQLEEFLGLPGVDYGKQQLPAGLHSLSPSEIVKTLRNRSSNI